MKLLSSGNGKYYCTLYRLPSGNGNVGDIGLEAPIGTGVERAVVVAEDGHGQGVVCAHEFHPGR